MFDIKHVVLFQIKRTELFGYHDGKHGKLFYSTQCFPKKSS